MSESHKKQRSTKLMESERCPEQPCPRVKVEEYMRRVLRLMGGEYGRIHESFEYHEIIEIIHACLTIFADEPIMLQFRLPIEGLVVIGDLHGDEYCLLKSFEFYGFPPHTSYLFLGDIIDRGKRQNEILLFILLMKLRWPEYIYILRGNHETYDVGRYDFKSKCLEDYNNGRIFLYLNQMFDHLSLCAIVSDYFFICHGGISQWMTSRTNITSIRKPTDMNHMTILQGCIVADLLWSDPSPNQKIPFRTSRRGISYTFNQEAVNLVLQALNVQKLIRGHQVNETGVMDNFGDESCITVHTSVREDEGFHTSGTIKIIRGNRGAYVIERRTVQVENRDVNRLIDYVSLMLSDSFKNYTLNRATIKCRWCRKAFPKNITKRLRCTGPIEAAKWINRFALDYALADDQFTMAWEDDDDIMMNERAYELFPVIYDMRGLTGGSRLAPSSYRIYVNEEEKALMLKFFPYATNFVVPELLAFDFDPSLQSVRGKKRKPGKLERATRRLTNVIRHAIGFRDLPSSGEDEPKITRL